MLMRYSTHTYCSKIQSSSRAHQLQYRLQNIIQCGAFPFVCVHYLFRAMSHRRESQSSLFPPLISRFCRLRIGHRILSCIPDEQRSPKVKSRIIRKIEHVTPNDAHRYFSGYSHPRSHIQVVHELLRNICDGLNINGFEEQITSTEDNSMEYYSSCWECARRFRASGSQFGETCTKVTPNYSFTWIKQKARACT